MSPGLHDGHYAVLIDGKKARTRLKLQPLEVPSFGLAVGIALEYDMQDKRKVEDITMPLTWLASVAIDRTPEQRKTVGGDRGAACSLLPFVAETSYNCAQAVEQDCKENTYRRT